MQINPYYYSHYLYERVNRQQAFEYLNQYFKSKYNQEAFINISQDSFDDIHLGEPPVYLNFETKLKSVYRSNISDSRTRLIFPAVLFFAELWQWAPINEIFTLPELPNQDFSENEIKMLVDILIKAVESGEITYSGEDFEEQNLPETYAGRLILDPLATPSNYKRYFGFKLLDDFTEIACKIEDESPYIYPEIFWQHQLETKPLKVLEAFLYTLFIRYYNRVNSALQNDLEIIQQFIPFATATKKAITIVLDTAPEEILQALPCYAGYSHVTDARQWLIDLLDCLRGRKRLDVLGERK